MDEPDIFKEQLVAIRDVPDCLPGRRQKRIHVSTIHRWVLKGARGKILESIRLGGIRYTSLEALQRFLGGSTREMAEQHRKWHIQEQLTKSNLH